MKNKIIFAIVFLLCWFLRVNSYWDVVLQQLVFNVENNTCLDEGLSMVCYSARDCMILACEMYVNGSSDGVPIITFPSITKIQQCHYNF